MKNELQAKINKTEEESKKLKTLEVFQSYEGKDKIITSEEAWDNLEEERKKPAQKLFTKIPTLDKMIDGFRQGDLVVVSGPTKNGKSSICQTFTHNLAKQEISCLWFSYEMCQMEFLEKFGEPMPFFTLPQNLSGNSLEWIEQRIIESISKYGTKIVFIDHLHFLIDMSFVGQKGNVSLLIGSIMRKLKQIAIAWNITIVLVAHTTKLHLERDPELVDIRDSSFISQEADTVLMIRRSKSEETGRYENKSTLSVLANRRNGRVGNVKLQLDNNKFTEITDVYETD